MQVNIDTSKGLARAEQLTKNISIPEIKSKEDYIIAVASRRTVKDRLKELKEQQETVTKPLHVAKSNFINLLRPFKEKLESYIDQLDPRIIAWDDEQEKIRQKEEDRLKRLQEIETAKLLKRAENAKKPETKERLEEEAEIIASTPAIVLPPKKVEGISYRADWKWKLVDFSKVDDVYKKLDEVKLNGMASSSKGTLKIDGIEFYSVKIAVGR